MEAVHASETLVNFVRLHGAISQKAAVRTWNLIFVSDISCYEKRKDFSRYWMDMLDHILILCSITSQNVPVTSILILSSLRFVNMVFYKGFFCMNVHPSWVIYAFWLYRLNSAT
jgi:hypothetical protein